MTRLRRIVAWLLGPAVPEGAEQHPDGGPGPYWGPRDPAALRYAACLGSCGAVLLSVPLLVWAVQP